MAYEEKENSGNGFLNTTFTGRVDIAGTKYSFVMTKAHKDAKFAYEFYLSNKDMIERTVLFTNDKATSDKAPQVKGQILGHWIACWIKKSEKGNDFASLKFTAKDGQPVMDNTKSFADTMQDDLSDSIPF